MSFIPFHLNYPNSQKKKKKKTGNENIRYEEREWGWFLFSHFGVKHWISV